jgi:Flp pilus assembly protein TadD
MAIKGSLKEASLPDVLQLVSLGQKTGCLSVTHRTNLGSIYFDKGRICFASIVNRRDRLGDILVKSGKLTQAQLDAAIAEQARDRNVRIGDILVRQGVLSRDQLNDQIRVQIEEAVYFLFTWTEGTFNFEPDVRPELQDFLVSIRTDALLLEGARRVDEWSLIEKRIPSFDIVFDLDRRRLAESGVALTAEQQTVARLLDGRRDVKQIAEESGLVEFEVGKALYGLVTAGFLTRTGMSRAVEPKVPEARVEEHRNLGIAFYKTGMFDESMRELRRVIDLRPRDEAARFYVGLSLIRLGRFPEAVSALSEAAATRSAKGAVFHNLAYALERLGRFDEALVALEQAERRGLTKDARVRTSLGMVALRRGDPVAADRYYTEARALFAPQSPTAAWFNGASLAAALQGDIERAGDLLGEGVLAYPHAAVLLNNLAVQQERLGRPDQSFAVAARAVQEDATLPQLHKNVGDGHFHAGRADEAFEAYQRAVKIRPELGPDVYIKIGTIHAARGERADATRAWERALELDPNNKTARANLAETGAN